MPYKAGGTGAAPFTHRSRVPGLREGGGTHRPLPGNVAPRILQAAVLPQPVDQGSCPAYPISPICFKTACLDNGWVDQKDQGWYPGWRSVEQWVEVDQAPRQSMKKIMVSWKCSWLTCIPGRGSGYRIIPSQPYMAAALGEGCLTWKVP